MFESGNSELARVGKSLVCCVLRGDGYMYRMTEGEFEPVLLSDSVLLPFGICTILDPRVTLFTRDLKTNHQDR